ncbi:cryptochrome/photolyase family protein [Wenzhouxiangella limi]|uniref:Cryptochrome/photolyase family protein n=1 Tax=Wenzhouxiangella limi TaxID=2707351 RepID=A0A845UV36_9GAMM|nr:cryptochrome/photolyase family protein [Wenzhouxiangella limi]NDY95357.1 cryptochrome/photolyase family protein [Wenzhouxiangella limi]
MARLGLIFGDQLNLDHALLDALDPACDRLLMGELVAETEYVRHHGKKIALIFSAMRHFRDELEQAGWSVTYHVFDPDSDIRSFTDLVRWASAAEGVDTLLVAWPGEWRLLEEVRAWEQELGVAVSVLPDTRFLGALEDFERWARGRKQLRMEYFYRPMRRRTGLLMEDDQPVGGSWNFDADNRKRWRGDPPAARPMRFTPDATTDEVLALVDKRIPHFGVLEGFDYPVTRAQARRALAHFVSAALPYFGDFQDALPDDEDYLFHSRLSSSLNLGLLSPMEVCRAAEQAWRDGQAPLNAVEGFIRQIIGWREYIRGIYWLKMPDYADLNALGNDQPLPDWYWTGKTQMRCLARAIDATRQNAYAHHIQRLMVTGNFALLLGVVPREICEWYLAVYADAYDWVELPNTLGMVMHADGGLLASKPYAASGKYIQRMGDHCAHCRYRVANTVGEDACPFNALYWDFLDRHRERFERNPRMTMMYRNVDRMDAERLSAIRERAREIREQVERF